MFVINKNSQPPHDEAARVLVLLMPPAINRMTRDEIHLTRQWLLEFSQQNLKPDQALTLSTFMFPGYLAIMGKDINGVAYVLYGDTIFTGEFQVGDQPVDQQHIANVKRIHLDRMNRVATDIDSGEAPDLDCA